MPVRADSAGVPFEGREFRANLDAGDDGRADPVLREMLRRFRVHESGLGDVVAAVHAARLLVPLVAERGAEGIGPHGRRVDKTQELALVTVSAPDGRAVLPAFTSVDAMHAWDATARPIPVAASRVALAAAGEGTDLLVVDPGSPTELVLRRPAFRAIATGVPWTPCFEDGEVLEAFLVATSVEPVVRALQLAPGDPEARLAGPELLVQLTIESGLDRASLDALLTRLGAAWAADAIIADRVDSIALRLETC